MRFGSAIALMALGAILSFAVQDAIAGFDLTVAGYILMAAGALLFIVSLIMMGVSSSSNRRVSESRTLQDPATGESVRRQETRDF
ncbi:DUF6458 family protein [Citricoccus sp. GCM10030269]|uniref:DUF6458 family protein n=1 Tax=Citricoccus sp. GCM10030269 TaxID=3273388 RepID=UPI003616E42A